MNFLSTLCYIMFTYPLVIIFSFLFIYPQFHPPFFLSYSLPFIRPPLFLYPLSFSFPLCFLNILSFLCIISSPISFLFDLFPFLLFPLYYPFPFPFFSSPFQIPSTQSVLAFTCTTPPPFFSFPWLYLPFAPFPLFSPFLLNSIWCYSVIAHLNPFLHTCDVR